VRDSKRPEAGAHVVDRAAFARQAPPRDLIAPENVPSPRGAGLGRTSNRLRRTQSNSRVRPAKEVSIVDIIDWALVCAAVLLI
jgi:hypothetical protein